MIQISILKRKDPNFKLMFEKSWLRLNSFKVNNLIGFDWKSVFFMYLTVSMTFWSILKVELDLVA